MMNFETLTPALNGANELRLRGGRIWGKQKRVGSCFNPC
jgi:hypothetical protein